MKKFKIGDKVSFTVNIFGHKINGMGEVEYESNEGDTFCLVKIYEIEENDFEMVIGTSQCILVRYMTALYQPEQITHSFDSYITNRRLELEL